MRTTPTGIPYIDCTRCEINHPENRRHCHNCNSPSIFVTPETGDLCYQCQQLPGQTDALDEVTP